MYLTPSLQAMDAETFGQKVIEEQGLIIVVSNYHPTNYLLNTKSQTLESSSQYLNQVPKFSSTLRRQPDTMLIPMQCTLMFLKFSWYFYDYIL